MTHATIRTFRAPSAREALAKVREALGPEAVVLQAQELPGTLFRRGEFEVQASLDDSLLGAQKADAQPVTNAAQPQAASGNPRAGNATNAYHLPPQRVATEPSPAQQPLHQSLPPRDPRAPLTAHPSHEPAAPWFAQPTPTGQRRGADPAFAQEPGFAPPQPLPSPRYGHGAHASQSSQASHASAPAPRAQAGFTEWQEEVRELRAALDEARAMLSSFSAHGRAGAETMLAPAASEANAELLKRGVDSALAAQLIRAAMQAGAAHDAREILEGVRAPLAARLTADRAPWLRGGKHTLAFVGPTGVGKTTTLAKIAARALMEGNRRVGLVTVDTYRIGASEQLARYGEIMGVPAYVAKNPRELQAAIERCARCDLILIDTAGRSAPDQLARQIELVRAAPEVELHLVASAASGARDLAAIAERYSPLRPDRLVVTKVDEAAAPGAVLSAAAGLNVPVSCVCDGQRVPEDIHGVTRNDLVDLVLGAFHHDGN